ncbi:hypothetical protein FQN51_008055 [Onygenales sp. PD_10]|nr:hypothetical protein FQN51_008055 [Onygenales sp. PD_10]
MIPRSRRAHSHPRPSPSSPPASQPEHPPSTAMVSHPDTPSVPRTRSHSHSLPSASHPPPPPPASVNSSRISTSHRRHHHHRSGGRSHHGGSSSVSHHQPPNQFPIFAATGDVEVVIRAANQERRYLLHRLILARCSGFFDAGTSSEEWAGGSGNGNGNGNGHGNENMERGLAIIHDEDEDGSGNADRNGSRGLVRGSGATTRWRYELDWENREEDEVPILVQRAPSRSNTLFGTNYRPPQPPPARTKPPPPSQGFFRSITTLSGIQSALNLPSTAAASSSTHDDTPLDPTIRDYDNLFRIFYNYPPHLNSINIASAYSECKSLLALADMYDALSVTGPRVDHHLLRFSSRLYKQIAKYPPSYLRLGYLARSHVIFAEALIHVVGQWPAALPHLGPSSYAPLPDAVLDLIEDKVEDLEDLKARVEAKLFRLTLTTSRGERVSPTNAYLDWLAVSLFRQWVVENTTPPPQSILKPLPVQPAARSSSSNNYNYHSAPANAAAAAATNAVASPRQHNNTNHLTMAPMTVTTITAHPHPPSTNSNNHTTSNSAGAAHTTTSSSTTRHPSNPTPTSIQPFSPGRTYRLLGSPSAQSYLPHEELKKFLKLHPTPSSHESAYSRENLKRFERKMDEIKRLAREVVKPLMRNFLELDLRGAGGDGGGEGGGGGGMVLPYLTCTKVEGGDFPWD